MKIVFPGCWSQGHERPLVITIFLSSVSTCTEQLLCARNQRRGCYFANEKHEGQSGPTEATQGHLASQLQTRTLWPEHLAPETLLLPVLLSLVPVTPMALATLWDRSTLNKSPAGPCERLTTKGARACKDVSSTKKQKKKKRKIDSSYICSLFSLVFCVCCFLQPSAPG